MTNPVSTLESEIDALIDLDPKTPPLALRAAFCLGAMVALGLPAKQRKGAIEWLQSETILCMQEVGNYGRS